MLTPELRQIDFDMAGDGSGAPGKTVPVGRGEIRTREAAAQPQALDGSGIVSSRAIGAYAAHFSKIEPADFNRFYPP